ncbi:hypothetical protein B0H67DRAFT_639104 [Lasiosphaeris hirsuta]|uniref:Aminomethyltransferase n=1 Tax=Lasiosphaeris hirsuta TaxID=260670 RepID=A0AA40EAZ3_9PEZI|nr:hypothetical protein B0H67DRAFT_639104 [Lasiosphaeris hirsuta]
MQSARSATARSALRGVYKSSLFTATSSAPTSLGVVLSRRALSSRSSPPPPTSAPITGPRLDTAFSRPIISSVRHVSSSSSSKLAKTPLYDLHLAHGAKMVPFGGFHMPVQYTGLSVGQSHAFTREHSSIFDVSHMVQRIFTGPGASLFLQRITPSGVEVLPPHRSTLSCLLHADGSGGIVDDTIVTRLPGGKLYVVTNAACREKDDVYLDQEIAKWNAEHGDLQVSQEQLHGWGLVALQGPDAEAVLAAALDESAGVDLKKLYFGHSAYARLKLRGMQLSSPLLISRGGYTGEDGFEISIPADETVDVTEALLAAGGPAKVQFAGLGSRDSLRLEAGMCLYGHDLDDTTTPVEAGLSWIIPKERRSADAGFYGADVIAAQLIPKSKGGAGIARRRVGLVIDGAPAREGAEIVSRTEEGKEVVKLGSVTSGCPSPTLGKNIAMGYVCDGFHKAGTEVDVVVRGRPRKAVVTKMPFVPSRYWKGV